MTNLKRLCSALFVVLLANNIYAQDVYKWVDAKGVTHYSQTPPQNIKKFSVLKTYGQTSQNSSSALPAETIEQKPIIQLPPNLPSQKISNVNFPNKTPANTVTPPS